MEDLTQNAEQGARLVEEKGDIRGLGEVLGRYWAHKKTMAAGCEPPLVTKMIKIIQDAVWGQELTGAGGGGFLVAITKEPGNQRALEERLRRELTEEELREVSFHSVQIDTEGLVVRVD